MVLTEEVPKWFYIALATGAIALLGTCLILIIYFVRKYIDDNKQNWTEVKDILQEVAQNQKVHEWRLSSVEKQVGDRLNIVKYRE